MKSAAVKTAQSTSTVLFARYAPQSLEPKNSIGAKWLRMLEQLDFKKIVGGKRTAIKMHLGFGTGFTTVHPFFVRKLVDAVKEAGAKDVFVTDVPKAVREASQRGYTAETIGCQLVSASGSADKYVYKLPIEPAIKNFKEIEAAGEIVDAEALIDLSHVKGHGDCGFGGASKNLSMGCVTMKTRGALHALEGGLEWDAEKCSQCGACEENCPNGAIKLKDGKFNVFYHNCKYCQHCVLICPNKAIRMVGGHYDNFQRAMAATSARILQTFEPKNLLFINFLMNITIFCDCWGMTTPTIVPDIGIVASQDIVAIEQASLDLIETGNLIPNSLPKELKMHKGKHLFEQLHGKDPFLVVEHLAGFGMGSRAVKLKEIG